MIYPRIFWFGKINVNAVAILLAQRDKFPECVHPRVEKRSGGVLSPLCIPLVHYIKPKQKKLTSTSSVILIDNIFVNNSVRVKISGNLRKTYEDS